MLKKLFRPNIQSLGRPHTCSRNLCDPLNEVSLVARGHMKGPATTEHLYLCKYGQLHECGESCGFDEVCPVSGISRVDEPLDVRDYDSTNPLTWGPKPSYLISDAHAEKLMLKYTGEEPKEKKQRVQQATPVAQKTLKINEIYLRIESLVDRILYSDQRKKINAACITQQTRKAKREKDMYLADCAEREIPPNMLNLMMIDAKHQKNVHMLNILQRDEARITKYANYILQVYIRVASCSGGIPEGNKICPDAISLGTLYRMQQGMKVGGITLIPLDPFLADNLPLMNDLPKFQVNKKKYTQGERLILLMFAHGRKEGKTEEELAIVDNASGQISDTAN